MEIHLWKPGAKEWWTLERDEVAGAIPVIDYAHHEIHEGKTYEFSSVAEVVNGGTAQFVLRGWPAYSAHLTGEITAGGDALWYFFEAPTISDYGTEQTTVHNKNRNSTNTAVIRLYSGATITDDGTELSSGYIPGGTRNSATGGAGGQRSEWNTKTATDYLLRVVNISGATKYISAMMEWYEKLVNIWD